MSQVGKGDLGFKIKTISKLLTQNITNSITSLDLTSSQARVLGYLCYRTKRQGKGLSAGHRTGFPLYPSHGIRTAAAAGNKRISEHRNVRGGSAVCKQIHVTKRATGS